MALKKNVPDNFSDKDFIASFKSKPQVVSQPAKVEDKDERNQSDFIKGDIEELQETIAKQIEPSTKPKLSTTVDKKRGVKGKKVDDDYISNFIERKPNISSRLGKTVCISFDNHKKIQQVVQVVAENKISIFDYIDNVLVHHLEKYDDEITDIFNELSPYKIKK